MIVKGLGVSLLAVAAGFWSAATVARAAPSVQTLMQFPASGASVPKGGLTIDPQNERILFGTTAADGTGRACGTVYKVELSNDAAARIVSHTVVHTFPASKALGCNPEGTLLYRAGYLYGATPTGGPNSARGTVFRIALDGTFDILHSFGTDAPTPCPGLVADGDGNLYGLSCWNGPVKVFKISPGGAYTQLASPATSLVGSTPVAGPIFGPDGWLYGTTTTGGPSGLGTIFKISPTGEAARVHSFGAIHMPVGRVSFDGVGNLIGVTSRGGQNDRGVVYKITPEGNFITMHSFKGGTWAGPGYQAVTVGLDGFLYGVSDYVFRIDPLSNQATTLHKFDVDDPTRAGLTVDIAGRLYGATPGNLSAKSWGTIFRINP